MEKGQRQNLCHESAENVWKYGPRPEGTESEEQQTSGSDRKEEQKQKVQINKKRRSAIPKKKKVTNRKRTENVASKIEKDSERVPDGPFRSNLPTIQSNQENDGGIRRKRKQSAIKSHGFTRKQLLKMLADLDAEEDKNGTEPSKTDSDAYEMESEIKPKPRISARRGRGRGYGRGRGRSVTGKTYVSSKTNLSCYAFSLNFISKRFKEATIETNEICSNKKSKNNVQTERT